MNFLDPGEWTRAARAGSAISCIVQSRNLRIGLAITGPRGYMTVGGGVNRLKAGEERLLEYEPSVDTDTRGYRAPYDGWIITRQAGPFASFASTTACSTAKGPMFCFPPARMTVSLMRPILTSAGSPRCSAASRVGGSGAVQRSTKAGRSHFGRSNSRAMRIRSMGAAVASSFSSAWARRSVKPHLVARRRTEVHSSEVLTSHLPRDLYKA